MCYNADVRSPLIDSCMWGRTLVLGTTYRDVLIYPGGVEEWDWSKADTHHEPGIREADLSYLLTFKPDIVILSEGFHRRLSVDFEAVKLLLKVNLNFLIADTDTAVAKYNDCVKNNLKVVAAIHSTC
jgi:hypothetical protein